MPRFANECTIDHVFLIVKSEFWIIPFPCMAPQEYRCEDDQISPEKSVFMVWGAG